jgi:hypothetical protein
MVSGRVGGFPGAGVCVCVWRKWRGGRGAEPLIYAAVMRMQSPSTLNPQASTCNPKQTTLNPQLPTSPRCIPTLEDPRHARHVRCRKCSLHQRFPEQRVRRSRAATPPLAAGPLQGLQLLTPLKRPSTSLERISDIAESGSDLEIC